jgi:phospholipid N-methyltransferase|tara:strand:+ start:449 stop:1012 length:564 start_codon:yes stop_codon:yes gene_type:complete
MNSKLVFLSNFIKKPKEVAAIAPSSKYVINRILKNVSLYEADCIVEYGSGTGKVTHALLEKMRSNSKLICFETNLKFYKYLKENVKDDRFIVVNDTAENLDQYLKKFGVEKVDYVFSGLPFSLIKPKNKEKIIEKTRDILKKRGKFIVYQQYSKLVKKYLKLYFKNISMELEVKNIPPTFVFVCEKI